MSVLGESRLKKLVSKDLPLAQRLVISPLLDEDGQIQGTSVDLRLGGEFITTRKTNLKAVDLADPDELVADLLRYQERVRTEFGNPFYLHPGQLVLGSTLEYIGMPRSLSGQVVGRSSWARLGLIIEMASIVGPGFKGVITLELINIGEVPIALFPGITVAQLQVFNVVGSSPPYSGKYRCPTGPQYSRVHLDKELQTWNGWNATSNG